MTCPMFGFCVFVESPVTPKSRLDYAFFFMGISKKWVLFLIFGSLFGRFEKFRFFLANDVPVFGFLLFIYFE
ncbi:hypothetical protein Hanom_Chr15g01393521 [Helianthus anomalus]